MNVLIRFEQYSSQHLNTSDLTKRSSRPSNKSVDMSNSSVSSSDSSSSQHQQLIKPDLTGGSGAQNFTKSTPPATTLSSFSSTRSTSAKTTRSLLQQALILSRYDIDSIFMTIRIFRSFRLPSGPI